MPILDGEGSARAIREHEKSIPPRISVAPIIIALTANATSLAQSKCVEVGMDLYLTKPLKANDLFFSVAALDPFNLYPLYYCPHILNYDAGQINKHAVPDLTEEIPPVSSK